MKAVLERGCISKVCHSKENVRVVCFRSTEKVGGSNSHKFEGYESFHSVHKLQDYMCIINLKDAYFSVPLHRFTKISTASLGRELVRDPVYGLVWDQLPEYLQNY